MAAVRTWRDLYTCAVWAVTLAVAFFYARGGMAAGILSPRDAARQPIVIRDHHVNVTINNGFAMTEVTQTFFNPNDKDLEAIYSFPLPRSASLSEVTIYAGEKEIHGEVLPKQQAREVYEEERNKGNDAGLAEKKEFYAFEFFVSPVRAGQETRIRFLYYQPLKVELGVGRYLYPLQEGGTDDAGMEFWSVNDKVENFFTANIELKSAYPVEKVRVPGFESETTIDQKAEGHYAIRIEKQKTALANDLIVYYRLQDNLPGRVEFLAHRPAKEKPGTFMMVVTPGMDLKPLDNGADYTFVLDVSGSMSGKIHTLARGVAKTLGQMKEKDRFRVISFNDSARDVSGGWMRATPENVRKAIAQVDALQASGSTNLYSGIRLALQDLDADRATSIVLVTDGVTNTGEISPAAFHKLMKQYDVRVFGFLMGNSGNWPLMEVICKATGGFYSSVSNDDDIVGVILKAKEQVLYECMHDAELMVAGVKTHDAALGHVGKVYRGQQLVVFGRYDKGGRATVTLKGRMTGEDKTYITDFDFPDTATDSPEIERLWALDRVEFLQHQAAIGALPETEMKTAVRDLSVACQIVTDETSMVVLSDETFAQRGIERRNRDRIARERQARIERAAQPPAQHGVRRVDSHKPAFHLPTPSIGGGGALGPASVIVLLGTAWIAGTFLLAARRHDEKHGRKS